MKSIAGTLAAPFPYFGGKANACDEVWRAFGDVDNYVEPFCGSAAMLLGAPDGKRVETINDADGFVANFWRAVASDAEAVAEQIDWPTNEVDLFARHSWLVRQRATLLDALHGDPEWYDAKIAGWWCWGACNWIGGGWCSGVGPWTYDDGALVDSRQLPHLGNAGQGVNRKLPHLGDAGQGVNRQLPHLGDAGQGVNRKLPHLGNAGQGVNRKLPHLGDAGRGVNRQLPHLGNAGRGARAAYIHEWLSLLQARMRDVRVACGDWTRVLTDSVTTRHGVTAVFLDPPYTNGRMDYAAGGVGGELAGAVRDWCDANGHRHDLRIVLCGHDGEHDALGWEKRRWTARKGYARTEAAIGNSASETLWCSPHCVAEPIADLFAGVAA